MIPTESRGKTRESRLVVGLWLLRRKGRKTEVNLGQTNRTTFGFQHTHSFTLSPLLVSSTPCPDYALQVLVAS